MDALQMLHKFITNGTFINTDDVYDAVEHAVAEYSNSELYLERENSLIKLFQSTLPNNDNITDILIKAATVNTFCNTGLTQEELLKSAKKIRKANIDKWVQVAGKRDDYEHLINFIDNHKHYSFITYYCNYHHQEVFPFYDKYVLEALKLFMSAKDTDFKFKPKKLNGYIEYIGVIDNLVNLYNLYDKFKIREINIFLWLLGFKSLENKF